jgi:hypothetical protein
VEAWARDAKGLVLEALGETSEAVVERGTATAIFTTLGVPSTEVQ